MERVNCNTTMKLFLPRSYLSYSQWDLWLKNKPEYKRIYFYGGKSFENGATRYGKKLANALELDEDDGDEVIQLVKHFLPKYSSLGHKLLVPAVVDKQSFILRGDLDSFDPPTLAFDEFKTGSVPWTQRKVDSFKQITWYTTLIYLSNRKLPPKIRLIWAPTEKKANGEIIATGDIHTFSTSRTVLDCLQLLNSAKTVALEISKAYSKEFGL